MLTPTLFSVPYRSKAGFIETHDKHNIGWCLFFPTTVCFRNPLAKNLALAIFTTSYARTVLYKYVCAHKLILTALLIDISSEFTILHITCFCIQVSEFNMNVATLNITAAAHTHRY